MNQQNFDQLLQQQWLDHVNRRPITPLSDKELNQLEQQLQFTIQQHHQLDLILFRQRQLRKALNSSDQQDAKDLLIALAESTVKEEKEQST